MESPKTKKSLGQHWLHDETSLEAMCEMAGVEADDYVLEIGPGLGTLTEKLLARGAYVHAVEFDQDLARELPLRIQSDRLAVSNEDILKFNLTNLPKDYKVVANIPYYLTSNLMRVLSEAANPPLSATILIQKEVAERLCAAAGEMSQLSVFAQLYFVCSLGPIVPAELFTPPPKVDSQIVHLARRPQPLSSGYDEKHLKRLIKAGFANKRKTLHNSLAAGLHMSKPEVLEALTQIGLLPTVRPQELSLEQWLALSKKVYSPSLS